MPTPPTNRRGHGTRQLGVQVGCALRIRIDQYAGPPTRHYIGLPGKSVRLGVANAAEVDDLFRELVKFLEKRTWRKR